MAAIAKEKPAKAKTGEFDIGKGEPVFLSYEARHEQGSALRDSVPRSSHAGWKRPPKGRDPVEILRKSSRDRLPELVPIRYGRMLRSPFTFLRGSAGLMAYDLATTPATGIRVQACGDRHLLNFGLFATPERNLVFDMNDFDETLPAPWEWDIKRLVVSFVVAALDNRLTDKQAQASAIECVRTYRTRLLELSNMSPLDVWYDRLDAQMIIDIAPNAEIRKIRKGIVASAWQRVVTGQWLMQSSSDIFLGWAHGRGGRSFYVRQLRDMKMSAPIEGGSTQQFMLYAGLCGRTLARTHAKSGDPALISGYLGKSDTFDQAIGALALAYADRNARDHSALVAAVKSGRIKALAEEE